MGLIKKKDLITIHDLFKYKGGLFLPIKDNNSIIKYSCALWKRYFTLRPFAKYIFKNPRCGLLMVTIRKQISYTLRCVFLIQKDVPLRRFL